MSSIQISPGISTNISAKDLWFDLCFKPRFKKTPDKVCNKKSCDKKPCKKAHQYIKPIDKKGEHKHPVYNPMWGSYNSYFYFDYLVVPPKPTPKRAIIKHEIWLSSNIIDNRKSITQNEKSISKNKSNISTNVTNISKNKSNISTNAANIDINKSNIDINKTNIASNLSNINVNKQNITKNANDITDINNVLGSNVWKIFNE